MSSRIHHFFDNIGGLNLHATVDGLENAEAEEIENLHTNGNGNWSSRNVGYTVITPEALNSGAAVTGMGLFVRNNHTQHAVAAAGSKVYEFNIGAGTGTEIGDGFTAGVRMNFATFQNLLILCNGHESPKKWGGAGALMELAGWPPSIAGFTPGYPGIVEVFANRLIFSGDADNPSVLYISALEDPQDFTPTEGATSAGAIQVSPGDGQKITGLKSLYLPVNNEEVLVIFKERSIYLLTGHDADTFAIQKVTGDMGAVSHNSIVQLGSDVMFLSEEGISTLTTATLQGNLSAGSISQKIAPQMARLNRAALSESFAVHLPYRHEVWWFVPEGSSTQNQRVLVLNYNQGKAIWSRRWGITAACGVVINNRLYTGAYNGHVHRQLDGNTYAGDPVTWRYRTPFYPLGNRRQRKRIREVEVYMTQLANTAFEMKAAWDFVRSEVNKQTRTVPVTLNSQSVLYGSGEYGADRYDAAGVDRKRLILNGSGRSLQLEFSGTQTGQPVEIQGWSITTIEGGFLI